MKESELRNKKREHLQAIKKQKESLAVHDKCEKIEAREDFIVKELEKLVTEGVTVEYTVIDEILFQWRQLYFEDGN